jgi:hypothetical protein
MAFTPSSGPILPPSSIPFSYVGDGTAVRTLSLGFPGRPTFMLAFDVPASGPPAILKFGNQAGDVTPFGNGVTFNADGTVTLSAPLSAFNNALGVNYSGVAFFD